LTKYVQLIRNWFIVAILASSLLTSCSSANNEVSAGNKGSAGNKDCEILLQAKKLLMPSAPEWESLNYDGSSVSNYYSKIEESQLIFDEPKVREAVSGYLNNMNLSNEIPAQLWVLEWDLATNSFVKMIDNYCNSL
jgi:hypothetical protein